MIELLHILIKKQKYKKLDELFIIVLMKLYIYICLVLFNKISHSVLCQSVFSVTDKKLIAFLDCILAAVRNI